MEQDFKTHDFIKNIYIAKLNCAMMIGILQLIADRSACIISTANCTVKSHNSGNSSVLGYDMCQKIIMDCAKI